MPDNGGNVNHIQRLSFRRWESQYLFITQNFGLMRSYIHKFGISVLKFQTTSPRGVFVSTFHNNVQQSTLASSM